MPSTHTTTELILIRHGETDWNRELRFQGHIDVPLNDTGHEQARRLGLRLADEPVDRLISSDLMRAQQTAAPAAHRLELDIVTAVGLREQNFGVVEGMRADEIRNLHPRAWEDWLQFREDHAMPEGESARQFHARIMEALGGIAVAHVGRRVLVVTHGGVLDMVWRTARGLGLNGPRQSEIPNAGFNRIRIADPTAPERIEILDWADVRHLADLPAQPTYDQRRHLKQ
jgi:probable phosphoglycerate mutase